MSRRGLRARAPGTFDARVRRHVLLAAFALVAMGCGPLRTMTAPSGDLADYRAYRVAAAEGTRLARAQRYLARHPKGVFSGEVRQAFEDEEPRFFEKAQASREGIRGYLADLPDGPHAEAARALLVAAASSMREAELQDIASRARKDDARLEAAARQRRAVGAAIMGAVSVLLDDDTYGRPPAEGSPALRALMGAGADATWGAVPRRHEQDLFFVLPTRPVRESRLVTLEISLEEEGGVVTGASVAAQDMFFGWAEADAIEKLDRDDPRARRDAHDHAAERLGNALERRFPAQGCEAAAPDDESASLDLLRRACGGWSVVVRAARSSSERDVIRVTKRGEKEAGREPPEPAKP